MSHSTYSFQNFKWNFSETSYDRLRRPYIKWFDAFGRHYKCLMQMLTIVFMTFVFCRSSKWALASTLWFMMLSFSKFVELSVKLNEKSPKSRIRDELNQVKILISTSREKPIEPRRMHHYQRIQPKIEILKKLLKFSVCSAENVKNTW